MARIGSSGSGGFTPPSDLDGGFANSVYLVTQVFDGGGASG